MEFRSQEEPRPPRRERITSIDALRGLVMLLMLVDHAREFFYLHAQVTDPMDLSITPPALAFTRLTAHLCAPVFVLLTGLATSLYAVKHGGPGAASAFLLKRGLFLVLLEVTLVNFAWTFALPPRILYLQVIWAIGLSMIALAGLLWLPRPVLLAVALAIMLGHNLLSPLDFAPGEPGHELWAILHDRGWLHLPGGLVARTSYPVLPWVGVIAAGYTLGGLFQVGVPSDARRRGLVRLAGAALAGFGLLRALNGYGEPVPWRTGADALGTVLSFLNLTKYPPSADFLLLTLGVGLLLLALFERWPGRVTDALGVFGGAPLFFYLLHLYVLHGLYRLGLALLGPNVGERLGVGSPLQLWFLAAAVVVPLYPCCRAFVRLKRRSGSVWLSYL
jgi:uncharacterized membrane protein